MPGVNLSPDSANIFSQPQKTNNKARINEPARVDAPGRAISKAERHRVNARLREALSEEQLWPALRFRSIQTPRASKRHSQKNDRGAPRSDLALKYAAQRHARGLERDDPAAAAASATADQISDEPARK